MCDLEPINCFNRSVVSLQRHGIILINLTSKTLNDKSSFNYFIYLSSLYVLICINWLQPHLGLMFYSIIAPTTQSNTVHGVCSTWCIATWLPQYHNHNVWIRVPTIGAKMVEYANHTQWTNSTMVRIIMITSECSTLDSHHASFMKNFYFQKILNKEKTYILHC